MADLVVQPQLQQLLHVASIEAGRHEVAVNGAAAAIGQTQIGGMEPEALIHQILQADRHRLQGRITLRPVDGLRFG